MRDNVAARELLAAMQLDHVLFSRGSYNVLEQYTAELHRGFLLLTQFWLRWIGRDEIVLIDDNRNLDVVYYHVHLDVLGVPSASSPTLDICTLVPGK